MRKAKITFWVAFVVIALFLYWFLPKYSFVHKNPGYCVNVAGGFYFCGSASNIAAFSNSK